MTRTWTNEEVDVLREHYPEHGARWDGWGRLLPGRSEASITHAAERWGVRHRRYWTEGEDEVLRTHYPSKPMGWPGWKRLLPGRTRKQVRNRAAMLGLKCPRGEGWTDAQRRDLILSVNGVATRTGHTFLGCVKELNNLRDRHERGTA